MCAHMFSPLQGCIGMHNLSFSPGLEGVTARRKLKMHNILCIMTEL